MSKQNNLLSFIVTKIIAIILISLALFFVYMELAKFNLAIQIRFAGYEIDTYLGSVVFAVLLVIFCIFYFISAISYIINGFEYYKQKYYGAKKSLAISEIIESAILLAIGSKKEALDKINLIDTKYLSEDKKDYLGLMKALCSAEVIPVALYGYLQKFPFIRNKVFKKLANIEYKLANYEKALEYARQCYAFASGDEEVALILAKIYFAKEDFKSMDGVVLSMLHNPLRSDTLLNLSDLYLKAARIFLKNTLTSDSVNFAIKSLDLNPENIQAAELFAEIATSQKEYDLVRDTLLNAFEKHPDFQTFLVMKKYTNMSNIELYNLLAEKCDYNSKVELFLAIATILDLEEVKLQILSQIT